MSAHTPGPWFAHDTHEAKACRYISTRSDRDNCGDVAVLYRSHPADSVANERDEANARLIAAAPEMYEAMKEIRDAMEDSGHMHLHRERVLSALDQIDVLIRQIHGTEADPCSS